MDEVNIWPIVWMELQSSMICDQKYMYIYSNRLIKSELTQPSKPAKFHAIYPAIGKRSLPSASTTKTENFFLDLHRSTRHHFYESVEKYLFAWANERTLPNVKLLSFFFILNFSEKATTAAHACWKHFARSGRNGAKANRARSLLNSFA